MNNEQHQAGREAIADVRRILQLLRDGALEPGDIQDPAVNVIVVLITALETAVKWRSPDYEHVIEALLFEMETTVLG